MGKIFENLKSLKEDMKNKDWYIDSFLFKYKQQEFIVLVKLYMDDEIRPDYALLKIEFVRGGNFNDNLLVAANSVKLFTDAKTLREYFKIEHSKNLGDLLQQFNQHFSTFIPKKVSETKSKVQQEAMVYSLSRSDSENPNKLYCYAVGRNSVKADGTLQKRSPFNENKIRILRPELYQKLKDEKNVSFWFSTEPSKEKSNEDILYNWAKNKSK